MTYDPGSFPVTTDLPLEKMSHDSLVAELVSPTVSLARKHEICNFLISVRHTTSLSEGDMHFIKDGVCLLPPSKAYHKPKYDRSKLNEVIISLQSGVHFKVVSKNVGIPRHVLTEALKDLGYDVRELQKKYTVKKHVFEFHPSKKLSPEEYLCGICSHVKLCCRVKYPCRAFKNVERYLLKC